MKKIISFFCIAVAAIAFASCEREQNVDQPINEGVYTYSFAVVGESSTSDEPGTKAEIADDHIEWVANDQIGMFVDSYRGYARMDVSKDPVMAVLYSTSEIPANTIAYGYYPYNEINKTGNTYDESYTLITFPSIQHGAGTSAMPLAAIPFTVTTAIPEKAQEGNGLLQFLNLGSIAVFKVYSTNSEEQTETVQYIEYEAANNAVIAGDIAFDLTSVDPDDETSLAVTVLDNESSLIKVNQVAPVATAKTSAQAIKMVLVPGTYEGTLKVATDAHTYYFNVPSREFARSSQRTFNVNLANAVTKEGVDLGAKTLPYTESFASDQYEFTVQDISNNDNYTIWSHGGTYIKATGYDNSTTTRHAAVSRLLSPWINLTQVAGANVAFDHCHRYAGTAADELTLWILTDDSNATWEQLTISSWGSGTNWTFVNSGNIDLTSYVGKNVRLAFQYSSDGTDSGTSTWEIKNFSVTKQKVAAGIAYATDSYNVNIGDSFTAPTLTNPNSLSVSYSSSNTSVASVDASTGAVTLGSTAGTATITATFVEDDDYYGATASYTITLVDPNGPALTGWVETAITALSTGDVVVIVDKTSSRAMSNDGAASSAPTAVSVTLGTDSNSNSILTGTIPANIQWSFVKSSTAGKYQFKTGDDYLYTTNTNNGVRVGSNSNNVFSIVTDSEHNHADFLYNDGTSRYLGVYYNNNVPQDWRCYTSINTNINATVLAFYKNYGGGSSTPTTYSVTVSPTTNGTVTASPSSNLEEDDEVTLTITPATNYELETLTVDGASVNVSGITGNTYTFYMPDHDVTVSATFKSTGGGSGSSLSFSWTRSGTTDSVTSGYKLTTTGASAKTDYYQDNKNTVSLVLTKSDDSALFTTAPTSISVSAKIGAGSDDAVFSNYAYACLVDNNGDAIQSTITQITKAPGNKNGTVFNITIPVVSTAYGVMVYHEKESGINMRYFSISFTAN